MTDTVIKIISPLAGTWTGNGDRRDARWKGRYFGMVRRALDHDMSYLELAALPSAPSWARRHAKAVLNGWQLWPEIIETAELLVSELMTNALKATESVSERSAGPGADRVALMLWLMPGNIVIEVFDGNPNPPVPAEVELDAESGRGLMLVQALSKEWGTIADRPAGRPCTA